VVRGKYVSRAGLKLASVAHAFNLSFEGTIVLDVGSSTGGFTDYALQHGAKKVICVEIGTNQLHPKLRIDKRVELHEKTDICSVIFIQNLTPGRTFLPGVKKVYVNSRLPTIILIDISFMSLRDILLYVTNHLGDISTQIVAMVKPQFEAKPEQLNRGIVKNEAIRRHILKDFEQWSKTYFVIKAKKDSEITGAKGNQERFYLLSIMS
jgi:23S rRNA (cytidine1920-2'-O)/16S rRNA (cytidine1409-2'-O)-methyltransferase